MTRAQNVNAVDLCGIDGADRPPDFAIADQVTIDFLAQFRCKLFGVVQATMTEFFRKKHGGGDNWTCQSAATRFVNPGNARGADGAEFFFVTKSAAPIHAVANLG